LFHRIQKAARIAKAPKGKLLAGPSQRAFFHRAGSRRDDCDVIDNID
jgi:hypothetical protein